MAESKPEINALFNENALTAPASENRQYFESGPYQFEGGGSVESVTVAYETWGTLNLDKSNAILVCHALTSDSHCIGWWSKMVGPGRPIDTERYFVIGSNVLGGCQGTTGPASLSPDGKPYRLRFPMVTVGDMVEIQARLLDHLGIDCLLCATGGSMGGMQAIEWSTRFPARIKKVFATASCAAHSAMQIGFNEAGRQAVMRDPFWNKGNYDGEGPVSGLAVARMIGHLTFLSEASFANKFGRELQDKESLSYTLGTDFQVESYLNYQGDKFTKRFDANSLLYLTKAIDYFNKESLAGAKADFLFVSFSSDWIYPSHQSEELHQMALAAGCKSQHVKIALPYGHDSFLLDGELQGEAFRNFIKE